MKEAILPVPDTFFEESKSPELIRCKDCKNRKKNKFCLKIMKYKEDYGYCDEAERKEEVRPYDHVWDMYLDEFEDEERKEE